MSVLLRNQRSLTCMLRSLTFAKSENITNLPCSRESSQALLMTHGAPTTYTQRRNLFPSKLPFEWKPLVKVSDQSPEGSGDKEGLPQFDLKEPVCNFEKSEELKTANDDVKKIFSMEFANYRERREKSIHMLRDRVKRHQYDADSMEVYISRLTCGIRNMQRHMKVFPKYCNDWMHVMLWELTSAFLNTEKAIELPQI